MGVYDACLRDSPVTQEQHSVTLHKSSVVVDMHSDACLDVIRSRGRGERRVLERRHLPHWKEGGINVVVLNTLPKFGPEPYPYHTTPVRNALLLMDAVHQEISESPDSLRLVVEPDDIARARDENRIGVILGMEGAECVEMDLGLLRSYERLGLRVMNLTWHQRNLVADGVAEPSNAGLSHFGRALVAEANRLGIIIDVSHLSPRGLDDVLSLSDAPVMASHSNARAVCDHERNLDDSQLKHIAAAGGMVGVVFLGRFVGEDPTIEGVLDHVAHLLRVAGVGHVGMGPDYVDHAHDMIIAARRVAGPDQPVSDATIPYARGLEHAGKLPDFTRGLVACGYDDATIRGVLGENFITLFRKVRSNA